MADIELIIKISEDSYKATCSGYMLPLDVENVVQGIKNGTPLPKGHGDLVDKKEIIERYKGDCGRRIYADEFIHDIEVNVPTIIEADTESEVEDGNN